MRAHTLLEPSEALLVPAVPTGGPVYVQHLERRPLPLAGGDPELLFVLLNPTVSGGVFGSQTLRRCDRFALALGYSAYRVLHLFGLVARRPSDLVAAAAAGVDPVGPGAEQALCRFVPFVRRVVVAWGAYRAERVTELVAPRAAAVTDRLLDLATCPLECFGAVGLAGSPLHPLFVRGGTPLRPWRPRRGATRLAAPSPPARAASGVAAPPPAPAGATPATRPDRRPAVPARSRRRAPVRRSLVVTPRRVAPSRVVRALPSLAEERRVPIPLL